MRRYVITGVVLFLGGVSLAGQSDLERTLDAIRMVESGGDCNAVGDKGKAIGSYQIHRGYWADGTQALGVDWPYSDARNEAKARKVVRAYLLRYEPKGTPESWCRLHNSGPAWRKKLKATDRYWAKARKNWEVWRLRTPGIGP